jgi:hypothetical protein
MHRNGNLAISRTLIYVAMFALLIGVFVGAYAGASPILLAVGFIGEIILVSTVHLSSAIQATRWDPPGAPPEP